MEELKNWNVWVLETEEMEAPIDVKVKTNYLVELKLYFLIVQQTVLFFTNYLVKLLFSTF